MIYLIISKEGSYFATTKTPTIRKDGNLFKILCKDSTSYLKSSKMPKIRESHLDIYDYHVYFKDKNIPVRHIPRSKKEIEHWRKNKNDTLKASPVRFTGKIKKLVDM